MTHCDLQRTRHHAEMSPRTCRVPPEPAWFTRSGVGMHSDAPASQPLNNSIKRPWLGIGAIQVLVFKWRRQSR